MKYYFFKTIQEGSRDRLRPLKGQTMPDGSPVNTSINVQANRKTRAAYPTGTVFCSAFLSFNGSYYTVTGNICAMDLAPVDYKAPEHVPDVEMRDAYAEYKKEQESAEPIPGLFDSLFDEMDSVAAARHGKARTTKGPEKEEKTVIREKAPEKEGGKAQDKPEKNGVKPSPEVPSAALYKILSTDQRYSRPTVEKDGFCVDKDNWDMIMNNIVDRQNTMLLGPTGTGKTELILLACGKLGVECNVYNMGTIFDPISELLGVHRLSGGSSKFDYAKFAQDVQKPGVILLDELSRAPVTTNNVLFPCLDSRRTLPVDMAGGDDVRSIPVHPECVFFATANVGSEYTGTMSMDRALVGRFFPLELDYMKESDESLVLQKRMGISKADADNISKVADTVRRKYTNTELSSSLSTRETLRAARLIANGWPTFKAMEMTFLPLFEGTKAEGERSVVAQMIMSR